MNDCYSSGVELACPYESALNISQNNFTQACGLYYIFNSRFGGRVRERLGLSAHLNGPGMMFSSNIAKNMDMIAKQFAKTLNFLLKDFWMAIKHIMLKMQLYMKICLLQ